MIHFWIQKKLFEELFALSLKIFEIFTFIVHFRYKLYEEFIYKRKVETTLNL
jgi:hypothetical protein